MVADSFDDESLRRMTAATTVVITTVGPYALYGDNLLSACIENGTHYCDLAGEVQWIRKMIDLYQDKATQSGARIVNCCGFDSIPSDLGTQFLQEQAQADFGMPCSSVELIVNGMKGGGSGGTIASGLNSLKEGRKDREVAKSLVQPYSLNPADERSGPDGRDQKGVRFSELAKTWTAPFIMAVINMRLVRRSNALMNYAYGKDFRYSESMRCGKSFGGWLKAAISTLVMGIFFTLASFAFTRKHVVEKMLPKPGEGPNRKQRESGFFNMTLYGTTKSGKSCKVKVTGDRDPGYGSTSRMLSETAICLAKDELSVGGGLWTPASAMGPVLRQRLIENAGLTFTRSD
jgi:short subunit dehydrogenase-like uncharacterized protein